MMSIVEMADSVLSEGSVTEMYNSPKVIRPQDVEADDPDDYGEVRVHGVAVGYWRNNTVTLTAGDREVEFRARDIKAIQKHLSKTYRWDAFTFELV
jgi:hypothetical protein